MLITEGLTGRLPPGKLGALLTIAIAGGIGGALYLGLLYWLRFEEVTRLVDLAGRRVLRRR